jgi:hypothetical protein
MEWLTRNIDLAMPFPALCFLGNLKLLAREKPLDPEDMEEALHTFLKETNAFDMAMERLDDLAQKNEHEADAVEEVLDGLAAKEEGLAISEIKARLSIPPLPPAERLYTQLVDGFPLRIERERVRLASRLFRRFWLFRKELAS